MKNEMLIRSLEDPYMVETRKLLKMYQLLLEHGVDLTKLKVVSIAVSSIPEDIPNRVVIEGFLRDD